MPHALPMPSSGFQALILCGPGDSLTTFTANPDEFPKALIPIANRPMVWYPLDWCYRMGVTNIHLVTPESSVRALEAALSQNPHLTSLPLPRADILSPSSLDQTSGTAELLRIPEVQAIIKGDFLVLPCDLVCELPGESLLEAWMVHHSGLGGASAACEDYSGPSMGVGGEGGGRRGGLGVWYQTKGEGSTKGDETDFIMTAPLEKPLVPPPGDSLRKHVSTLVYSTTTATLKDITEEKGSFQIRHGLSQKHGRVRVLNTYRDAHIYIFPHWVLKFVNKNEILDSISEDVVGFWAKACWQKSLSGKLGLEEIFHVQDHRDRLVSDSGLIEEDMDIDRMSTTRGNNPRSPARTRYKASHSISADETNYSPRNQAITVPPILAYVQPPLANAPLIRRVDTAALLILVSLRLAKLDSMEDVGRSASSPFAHAHKIAYQAGVAQRCTVTKADCLLAENVTVEEKSVIKESIIGANCSIRSGSRLTRCILMDGAVVGEKCQLTGCILGRRSQIGNDCVLKDCEVQDGNQVPDNTDSKGEKFMVFEAMEDGQELGSGAEDGMDLGGAHEGLEI